MNVSHTVCHCYVCIQYVTVMSYTVAYIIGYSPLHNTYAIDIAYDALLSQVLHCYRIGLYSKIIMHVCNGLMDIIL